MNCKIFLVSCTILLSATVIGQTSQTCNCESNFQWVKKTFEDNDAGFKYVIDSKGRQAYEDHNKSYLEKVKAAKTPSECYTLLYTWMTFFRTGHIAISPRNNNNNSSTVPTNPDQFSNWPVKNVDLPKFGQYLAKQTTPGIEGIWSTSPYKIAIQKEGDTYTGIVVESGAETWKKGMVKIKMQQKGSVINSVFYLRDHSADSTTDVELIGSNHLRIGRFNLERTNSKFQEDPYIDAYYRMIDANKPYVERINATTLYMRIPSFLIENKPAIDSVIAANKKDILSTPNFILDIRSGTGGSDASFAKLLPILYTGPIRTVGVEYYSTRLNNQRMIDFINKPEFGFDEEGKKWAKRSYDKLEANLGKFINLDSEIVSLDKFDTIYQYPANIGIIINHGNGSTDEQFLLAAKQSKKVKLFGATTFGELDISNMYFIPSPCKDFELGYCLTRSMRIPEMTIDAKGIQPDYYIDRSIPVYKWTKYVTDVLNNK